MPHHSLPKAFYPVEVHLDGKAGSCEHRLPGCGHRPDLAERPLQARQVPVSDEAGRWFVETVETHDVLEGSETFRHTLHRGDESLLEETLERRTVLRRDARGEGVARVEQREHRGAAQAVVVGRPDHPWERIALLLMDDRRAGGMERSGSKPRRLESSRIGAPSPPVQRLHAS